MDKTYTPTKRDFIKHFNSPEDFREYLISMSRGCRCRDDGDSWAGGAWDKVLNTLIYGDDKCLPQAEKIIDQMKDAGVFTERLPILESAVVGHIPNIVATIAGHPKSMYRYIESEMEAINTPLAIYVETSVSAGVSHKEMTARGVAALAFVMAMSAIRPVEVYAVSAGKPTRTLSSIIVTKIASAPLDLRRATWMLTHAGYARQLAFSAMYAVSNQDTYNGYIGWAWDSTPTAETYKSNLRSVLGMQPQDVLISGGHLTDKAMLTNPIKWVKDMIKEHTEHREQE